MLAVLHHLLLDFNQHRTTAAPVVTVPAIIASMATVLTPLICANAICPRAV